MNPFATELTTTDAKPFDGLKAGFEFTDMRGRAVKFEIADLPEYLANTRAAIDATRGESGEIVGVPIDSKNHDKGDAAGWIVGVELAGDVMRFTPRWTDIGIDLISSGRQRFFSPTVDLQHKTVIGGSLTNWPATRAKGKTLLRPIELQEGEPMDDKDELDDKEKNTLTALAGMFAKLMRKLAGNPAEPDKPADEEPEQDKEKAAMPEPQNLAAPPASDKTAELEARVSELAELRFAEMVKAVNRKNKIADFCKRITGGSESNPRGLSVKADELAEVILSMPEEQADKLQSLLESAVVVDFSETGHNRAAPIKAELPANVKPFLKAWLAGGLELADFFTKNPEVGKADEFDLAEYEKESK